MDSDLNDDGTGGKDVLAPSLVDKEHDFTIPYAHTGGSTDPLPQQTPRPDTPGSSYPASSPEMSSSSDISTMMNLQTRIWTAFGGGDTERVELLLDKLAGLNQDIAFGLETQLIDKAAERSREEKRRESVIVNRVRSRQNSRAVTPESSEVGTPTTSSIGGRKHEASSPRNQDAMKRQKPADPKTPTKQKDSKPKLITSKDAGPDTPDSHLRYDPQDLKAAGFDPKDCKEQGGWLFECDVCRPRSHIADKRGFHRHMRDKHQREKLMTIQEGGRHVRMKYGFTVTRIDFDKEKWEGRTDLKEDNGQVFRGKMVRDRRRAELEAGTPSV